MNNIKMIIAGLFCLSNLQAMDWDKAFDSFTLSDMTNKMSHNEALDILEAANVSIDDNTPGDIVALYVANDLVLSKDKARLATHKNDLEAALKKYNAAKASAPAKASATNQYVDLAKKASQALADAIKAVPADQQGAVKQAVKEVFNADKNSVTIQAKKQAGPNLGRLSSKKTSKRVKR